MNHPTTPHYTTNIYTIDDASQIQKVVPIARALIDEIEKGIVSPYHVVIDSDYEYVVSISRVQDDINHTHMINRQVILNPLNLQLPDTRLVILLIMRDLLRLHLSHLMEEHTSGS